MHSMSWLSLFLAIASTVGLVAVLLQRLVMGRYLRRPTPAPRTTPGISILKPLCGIDDDLEQNLASFAALEWPHYEVLLGVKNTQDAAYPVAVSAAQRWPRVFRVVLQHGEPGLNPKVNQLVTLERAARFELLFISDSNAKVAPGALAELAALFENPAVGCVTSPIGGVGHQTLGALLDNLHLASTIGPGMVAAKAFAGKSIVVGKSMALRREVVRRLGGFEAYANVLAEDYVIGQHVEALGFEVAVAKQPVMNVAVARSVSSFVKRYVRWSVIHRTCLTLPTYLSQALLNPWPLAVLAALLAHSWHFAGFAAVVFLARVLIDASATRRLGLEKFGLREVGAVAVKDWIIFIAWVNGLVARTVEWRGNRLTVTHGSRLVLPEADEPEVAREYSA